MKESQLFDEGRSDLSIIDFDIFDNSTNKLLYNLNKPTNTFIVVIVFCLIVFILTVFFFSLLRTKLKTIYSPRLLLLQEKVFPLGKLPSSFFAWLSPAFMVNDDDIFSHLGLDALVYLRFLKLALKATIFALPFGIIVLLPLNVKGGMHLKEGLDQISMSNTKSASPKLWAHFIAVWVYSLAILYLINEEWKIYVLYRQAYMTKGSGRQYTLLVRDIPKENAEEDKFRNYMEKLFPNQIHSVYVVQDLRKWQSLIKKHDKNVRKLEKLKANCAESVTERSGHGNLIEPKTDLVADAEQRLQILQDQIATEQNKPHKNLPCAFIFFNSLSTRSTASQIVWDVLIDNHNVEDAPDSKEMKWKSLAFSKNKRTARKIISNWMVVTLIILWAIPITFVAFLTKMKSVAELKNFSFLRPTVKSSSAVGQGLIQGLIPVFLTLLFNKILPHILRVVGSFRGLISKSQIEKFLCRSLTLFLVVNTFFVFITAGAFFSKSQEIIEAPYNITKELAISLPSQANFYLNFVCLLAFGGTGLELTRLIDMIIIHFKTFRAKTPRERLEAWKPGSPPYAKLISDDLLIMLIGISYSVLSPIIIPAVFVYFAFTYIVWVYQLLHVYIPDHDIGGKLWPNISSSMIIGEIIFQLLMIGVFSLKKCYAITACLAPLPIITIIFWFYISGRYRRVGKYLSLREGRCMRDGDRQFLQSLANSYKLNHSYPGVYEVSSIPELEEISNNEYGAITNEEGRELHHSNYETYGDTVSKD